MNLKVIPLPQHVKFTTDKFQLKPALRVFVSFSEDKQAHYCADEIMSFFKKENIKAVRVEEPALADVQLLIDSNFSAAPITDELNKQAYSLEIKTKKIILTALTFRGLFYGIQTLKQLIEQFGWNLPGLEIIDYPLLKFRGISDDISRGQVSRIENFKKIISFIASYKMNVYMLYIEDMLKFDAYPSIGLGRGALSKSEVKKIVEFARRKFVDVIPIFETLGHFENILSRPKFLKYADFPGSASLNITYEGTYTFLETLIKQVAEEFPSEYIHIGADESFDVGKGASKKLVDSIGIAEAHAMHYKKVYAICKKFGKKPMIYGDIILRHPEILEMIPRDFIIVDWHYGANYYYPSVEQFNTEGFRTIVSPAVWNFLTTYPTNINALPNIEYFAKVGVKNNAIGLISSNWGDYGSETFKELLYFDYAWSAQCAWNVNNANIASFQKAFELQYWGVANNFGVATIQKFGDPMNQFLWHEIWRHPLLEFKSSPWWVPNVSSVARLSYIQSSIPIMKWDVEQLEKCSIRNKENLDIYKFLINLYSWYSLKMETTLALRDSTLNIEEKKKIALPLIKTNIDSLTTLNKEFRNIWLKYYKPANLNLIERKFNFLISYFKEIKNALEQDTLLEPLLTSKWIYSDENENWFKKEIEINDDIDSAKFQLIGDTFAKLKINGKDVDSVYARRTLSLTVEQMRVKMIDVKRYLKKGVNRIVVQAKKFGENAFAGFNLTGRIFTPSGTVKVESDSTWRASNDKNFEKLLRVNIKKYPFEIVAPDFKSGRKSWIER